MKKNIVLFVLFVLPIVAYLFFASGVNSFSKLPTLTPSIPELGNWQSLDSTPVKLDGKITVLGFGGDEILDRRGGLFNLNQKVYQRYHKFNDLQFVYVCPLGTEADVRRILTQFSGFTDISQWKFVFAPKDEIIAYHKQLKLAGALDATAGTFNVYLVDKQRNLRGRKGDDYKEGYDVSSPADLSNEMLDDFKIILYEYRAALKKNNNASRKI